MSLINKDAQAIIDRICTIDQTLPYHLDTTRIEGALTAHLKALKQAPRSIRWIGGNKEAFLYISKESQSARGGSREAACGVAWEAAWSVAWEAAREAVWEAAREAAWSAAIVNTLQDHPRYQEFCQIWLPFLSVFESGLFVYWVREQEIVAVPRPILRFRENQLHGDGMPAVEFPNRECYYFWRGIRIPEEWGKVNSEHWKPQWLLETTNAEQRRILIQELGYERIKATFPTTVIHTSHEMELVKITQDLDIEPIVILKVVCPSTVHPYILRVPPTMTTCEQARQWTLHNEDKQLEWVRET